MFPIQSRQPHGLARTKPFGLRLLEQSQAPLLVVITDAIGLASLIQTLGRVLPHWLEQAIPLLVAVRFDAEERFVEQTPEQVEHFVIGDPLASTNRLGTRQRPTPRKYRKSTEEQLLCITQEFVAPIQCCAYGSLPARREPRAAREDSQRM